MGLFDGFGQHDDDKDDDDRKPRRCPNCGGKGRYKVEYGDGTSEWVKCSRCHGSGEID